MAIDAMRQAFLNEGASFYLEAQEKAQRDLVSNLYDARLEGLEQGIKQGIEQGIEQGLKQARAEMSATVEAERRRAEQAEKELRELKAKLEKD